MFLSRFDGARAGGTWQVPGGDALLRALPSLGISLCQAEQPPSALQPLSEVTLLVISDVLTVTFKLNSKFQHEERESNIIWFLILVLVLKCVYYNIVWVGLGFV